MSELEAPFSTPEEARMAYYGSDGGDGENDGDDSDEWGEWIPLAQRENWHIWGREHLTEDRVQFQIAGETEDGTAIYLHPGGEIVEGEAHYYTSMDGVNKALEAYFQRKEEGGYDGSDLPTGPNPGPGSNGSGSGPPLKVIAAVVLLAALAFFLRKQGKL